MLTICSKKQVDTRVEDVNATHLISLLDPDDRIKRPLSIKKDNHLELWFEDDLDETLCHAPRLWHCEHILEFGSRLPKDNRTVVHCFGGIARSSAAALALYIQKHGIESAWHARQWIRKDRPQAMPNLLMAAHLDKLLNCNNKFFELCSQIGDSRVIDVRNSPDW